MLPHLATRSHESRLREIAALEAIHEQLQHEHNNNANANNTNDDDNNNDNVNTTNDHDNDSIEFATCLLAQAA